jgi:N-acetylmuramoyl-L-alanine amidase
LLIRFALVRLLAIALIVLTLAGCEVNTPPPGPQPRIEPPRNSAVSVYDMARGLGYTVTEIKPDSARLVAGNNTVTVYTDPRSEVYYNEHRIVKTRGIANRDGMFSVPAELESQLRQALPSQVIAGQGNGALTKLPSPGPVSGRVVIDPGHGGRDPGARAGGIVEKDLTLELSKMVAEELRRRGVTVLLTRGSDTYVNLEDRTRAANNFRANLFVAIHADVNPSSEKVGHTVILPQSGSATATQAARDIDRNLVANGSPSYSVRMDNRGLYVLRYASCPSVLVEVGFISNQTEASRFRDPGYRRKVAMGITEGILDYLRRK